jgi:hypothetical protein
MGESLTMPFMPAPVRTLTLVGAVLAIALATAAPVTADVELVRADPAAGSTLSGAPAQVIATYDDDLDPDKSSLLVLGPDGSTIGTGGVTPDDPKTMATAIPSAGPGEYQVRWTAASSDGHILRGTYTFTVSAAAPSPTPVASAATSPVPTPAPAPTPGPTAPASAPTPGPSTSPGSPDSPPANDDFGIVVVAAVAGLVVGGGIAWWGRRRGAS